MSEIKVTLNYKDLPDGTATFKPDPETARVKPSTDTIKFVLGTGPEDGKVRVTFNEPQFFGRGLFQHGEAAVSIKTNLNRRTTYKCELLVDGIVKAMADGASGGGVQPAGGDD